MDAALTMADRPLGRAGRAAARYQSTREEIAPLVALQVDLAALGTVLDRRGSNAGPRTQTGGEG